MNRTLRLASLALTSAALLAFTGCGGGSDSAPVAAQTTGGATAPVAPVVTTSTSLSGTAAIGAPINGTVIAIDINGKASAPATTTALGAFILNIDGLTAPFILTITGTAGGKQVTLNSIATAAGQTVNITPLTDLIVSTAAGRPGGGSLASLCTPVNSVVAADCLSALGSAAAPAKLNAAVAAVTSMIAQLNTAGTNPLTGVFTANGTGMDAVLDQILMSPALNGGEIATVTLISTNTPLGQVTLPSKAGDTATAVATALSQADLDKANASASVLPEVKACLAAFSALYSTTGFVVPTTSRVSDFIDNSFNLGSAADKTAFVSSLTDINGDGRPGLTIGAAGFAPYDMTPLTITETAALSSTTNTVAIIKARATTAIGFTSGLPTTAWVKLQYSGGAGLNNWKFNKGAAYAGCPGGWKLAGSGHLDMHMNARIQQTLNGSGTASISRQWAFHINKQNALAEKSSIDTVVVRGPGLSAYNTPASPVGASQRLVLTMPTNLETAMWVGNGSTFYGHADAIQSCQDLASTSAIAGTPCIDETQVSPGKLYSWELKSGGKDGTVVRAFPFQISAVPLSRAFAQANAASLFATITGVTPSTLSAMSTTLATFATGATLDNIFKFNYTQQSTYGSRMDSCGVYLYDNSATPVRTLNAEQNAVGLETSCTFNTSGLNAGSLTKPVGAVGSGYVGVTTTVLGNQASSSRPY